MTPVPRRERQRLQTLPHSDLVRPSRCNATSPEIRARHPLTLAARGRSSSGIARRGFVAPGTCPAHRAHRRATLLPATAPRSDAEPARHFPARRRVAPTSRFPGINPSGRAPRPRHTRIHPCRMLRHCDADQEVCGPALHSLPGRRRCRLKPALQRCTTTPRIHPLRSMRVRYRLTRRSGCVTPISSRERHELRTRPRSDLVRTDGCNATSPEIRARHPPTLAARGRS